MARVTARDVAEVAGVSQATVSYVINDNPNQKISPATRERVLRAVQDLGYAPSAAARALRMGTSGAVLLILPHVPIGPVVGAFIECLEAELKERGLGLVTRRVDDGEDLTLLWRQVMPAAVVSMVAMGREERAALEGAGIFLAEALLSPRREESTLSLPQLLVGRLQVEHLAMAGHRHIGYAAAADAQVEEFLRLRLEGVRMSCVELGLDLPDVQWIEADAAAAQAAVEEWRAREPRVTAVCAYNDEIAFVVLAGMRRAGLRAPEDLALIGVDNIPLAPFADPPLTTIDQNVDVSAKHLAQLVRAGIDGEPLPRVPRSESVTLVVRESA